MTVLSMVVGKDSRRRSHDLVDLQLCTSLSLILSSSMLKMACNQLDELGGCFRIFWSVPIVSFITSNTKDLSLLTGTTSANSGHAT